MDPIKEAATAVEVKSTEGLFLGRSQLKTSPYSGIQNHLYEHVVEHVVEHLPQAHLSSAQSALHKAAKQVFADQSTTTQAGRQSWREPPCRRAFTQLAEFSKRTEKSFFSRPTKVYNSSRSSLAGVMCEGFAFISNSIRYSTALSLRPFSMYFVHTCMRRPGCFLGAWSSWRLHVVSLHLKSWTSLSASSAFCSILVSERSGWRNPPAERSALYIIRTACATYE